MTDVLEALRSQGKHGVIIHQTNRRAKKLPKTCQNCIHCKCKPGTHSKRAYRPYEDEYVIAPKACEECKKLFDAMKFKPQQRYSMGITDDVFKARK